MHNRTNSCCRTIQCGNPQILDWWIGSTDREDLLGSLKPDMLSGAMVPSGDVLRAGCSSGEKGDKPAQRENFRDECAADILSDRVKNFGQAKTLKNLKNKHLGADIHEPNARTSMTRRGCKKNFRQTNFRLIFRFVAEPRAEKLCHKVISIGDRILYTTTAGGQNCYGYFDPLPSTNDV